MDFRANRLFGVAASMAWVEQHPIVQPIFEAGMTAFCVTLGHDLIAVYSLKDAIRPETFYAISIIGGPHPAVAS